MIGIMLLRTALLDASIMTDRKILRLANHLFTTASVRSMEPVQMALNRGAAGSYPAVPCPLNRCCRSTSRTVPGLQSVVKPFVESAEETNHAKRPFELASAAARLSERNPLCLLQSTQIKPLRVRNPRETTRGAPAFKPIRHKHPLGSQEFRGQLSRRLISARRRATQPAMVDLSEADSAYNLLFAPSTALL